MTKVMDNGQHDKDYDLHSAWYSGCTDTLNKAYVRQGNRNSFWYKDGEDGLIKIHIPVASDIASTSADLLFADFPQVNIPEADGDKPDPKAVKVEERLMEIIEEGDIKSRLIEASESCSALGGVFLKPTWDTSIADFPILSIAQADNAVPIFKWGFLVGVSFFVDLLKKDNVTIRHEEEHTKGKITNRLWKIVGSEDPVEIPLNAHPATAELMEEIDTEYDGLLVQYVPNMRPNRKYRGSAYGQSDYAGIESLMDALDEVFTSWLRDIRLARGRIIVPETFIEFDTETGQASFDNDKSIFTAVSADPLSASSIGMTSVQFSIRTEEHAQSAKELIERIVIHAGYSPQTFGLNIEGSAESGTALNIRERKTYISRQKKWRYWKTALENTFEMMLHIDKVFLENHETEVIRPTLKLSDMINRDQNQIAQSISMLHTAQAMSIDTKVRLLHPDWQEEEIVAEIERIKEEQGITMDSALDLETIAE